jgi:hypothetical protein
MKHGQNLLILLIILVGLLGTYFYLKHQPAKKAVPPVAAKTKAPVLLAKLDQTKIAKLVFKSAKGTLTLIKQKSVWQSEPGNPDALDQTQIETTASTFAGLAAVDIIDRKPRDLQQYGLAQPSVTVTVYAASETKLLTVLLGDQTPTGYNYYAQRQGDPTVYSIAGSDGGRFNLSLNELRDRSLPQIDPQQWEYFKLLRPGQRPIEVKLNPGRDKTGADYGLSNWVMVQPYQEPLAINVDQFTKEILPELQGLEKQEYVDDHPADLARYGLNPPRYDLLVKDHAGQTLHLLIGKERDADYFYAKTPDSPAVFTLSKGLNTVLATTPFQLVSKLGYLVNIDTVAKIAVASDTKKYQFTLTRKVKKARSKQEQDETVTTYRMDGKPVKEPVFKTFYRSLIGLSFEGDHQKQLSETNPEVQVTFYLNQGKTRVNRISFVAYNPEFDAVFHNGHSDFLISKDQIKVMLADLEALAQGKLKARDF